MAERLAEDETFETESRLSRVRPARFRFPRRRDAGVCRGALRPQRCADIAWKTNEDRSRKVCGRTQFTHAGEGERIPRAVRGRWPGGDRLSRCPCDREGYG